MKYKYIQDAQAKIHESFYQNCNPDALQEIESTIQEKGEGELFQYKHLNSEIRVAIHNHEGEPAELDGDMAALIHKEMNLTRRVASFASFWHYCTLFEYLDYVEWRWYKADKKLINKDRVLGQWRRNALGRLWWWAEITFDANLDDPYKWTKRCSKSQELMLHAVDDFIGGDNGIMIALCNEFFPREDSPKPDRNIVRDAFARLVATLDTIVVESLTDDQKKELVKEVIVDAQLKP